MIGKDDDVYMVITSNYIFLLFTYTYYSVTDSKFHLDSF